MSLIQREEATGDETSTQVLKICLCQSVKEILEAAFRQTGLSNGMQKVPQKSAG